MNLLKTQNELEVYKFEYIDEIKCNLLYDKYDHLLSQLIIMIISPKKWCH